MYNFDAWRTFVWQMQTGNEEESQLLQKEEPGKATSGAGGGSGSWQGWLTGWYSWSGSDTTDGTAGTTKGNDANPLFMGEPPTTKGKLIISLPLCKKKKTLVAFVILRSVSEVLFLCGAQCCLWWLHAYHYCEIEYSILLNLKGTILHK